MSANLRAFITGASMLRNVANRVPDGGWDQPSCCEGWTARHVAGHIVWGLETLASVAHGGEMADAMPEEVRAGDDPTETLSRAVDAAIAALDQPGTLDRPTPFGPMDVDAFLVLMALDSMTHAWDIADATGIAHGIDDATATWALGALEPMAAQMRGPGRFGDPVETESSDPLDRFIAFTGRTSVRD